MHDEAAARAILESDPVEPPGLDDLALATQPTTEEPPKAKPQAESSSQPVTSSGLDKLELTSVLLVTSAYPILSNLLFSEPAGSPSTAARWLSARFGWAGSRASSGSCSFRRSALASRFMR